jgi:hypothetical protein
LDFWLKRIGFEPRGVSFLTEIYETFLSLISINLGSYTDPSYYAPHFQLQYQST